MKRILFVIPVLFFVQITFGQKNLSFDSSHIVVRENINITAAYNAKKSTIGTFLLATTKSGYKIYSQNKRKTIPQIIIKDTKGNTVTTTGRRQVIVSEGRTVCLECVNVNRPEGTSEECFQVSCTIAEVAENIKSH